MGATSPRVFALPTAPQAGLNNGFAGSQTLCPAKKKQQVTDPKLCLPPRPPSKTFILRQRAALKGPTLSHKLG